MPNFFKKYWTVSKLHLCRSRQKTRLEKKNMDVPLPHPQWEDMSLKWAMIFALYKLGLTYTFGISSLPAWLAELKECQYDVTALNPPVASGWNIVLTDTTVSFAMYLKQFLLLTKILWDDSSKGGDCLYYWESCLTQTWQEITSGPQRCEPWNKLMSNFDGIMAKFVVCYFFFVLCLSCETP